MTKASWEIRFSRGAFFIIFSIAERMEEKIMDELTNAISEMGIALTSDVWGVWFLIGAAQCSLCSADLQWWKPDLQEQKMQETLL